MVDIYHVLYYNTKLQLNGITMGNTLPGRVKTALDGVSNKQYKNHLLKNEPVLYAEVVSATTQYNVKNFSEAIFIVLNGPPNIKPCGNKPSFISVNYGYNEFCGGSGQCDCSAKSKSVKVKISKKERTAEQIKNENIKRVNTTLKLHAVTNNGQTKKAKENHKLFYSDQNNCSVSTNKNKITKLVRYGNSNYNNANQARLTFKQKYGTTYWVERTGNENYEILHDKDKVEAMFKISNPYQMAIDLNVHIQTIYRYLNLYKFRTPYTSYEEMEVRNFISSLGITNVQYNTRKLIRSKKEIDIYLPDFKIAIEYNGLYYHHEDVDHITRYYHNSKFIECEELGIQLITIFSNFWKSNKDVVKTLIINKLGLSSESIYARKCKVQEVPAIEANAFLNKTHVQGGCGSTYKYGLYYNEELVCLMTFGKPRHGMGNNSNETGVMEIIRYASKYRVVGGASKLLKYFINQHNPTKIISFSDNEWSTGNLYKQLGFELESELPPSYWYFKANEEKLYHRAAFMKYKLIKAGVFDPSLSTKNNIKKLGILTVWDCGKRKWVLTLK